MHSIVVGSGDVSAASHSVTDAGGAPLDYALAYAARGWPVFPLHGIRPDGRCTCFRGAPDSTVLCSAKPPAPGKHPRVKGGFRTATVDAEQIRDWWRRWPDANVGISTGPTLPATDVDSYSLVVLDVDGPAGLAELQALVRQHGPLPRTLMVATGRGQHLYFADTGQVPAVRSSARGSLHCRGEGGYVVAPPSRHVSGSVYRWTGGYTAPAAVPAWLRAWMQGGDRPAAASLDPLLAGLGPRPAWLGVAGAASGAVAKVESRLVAAASRLENPWSAHEEARLRSCLAYIPADAYDLWLRVGMALHSLNWDRPDGTSIGFDLWNEWSARQLDKYSVDAVEAKWANFDKVSQNRIGVGTIYRAAQEAGWDGIVTAPSALAPAALNAADAALRPAVNLRAPGAATELPIGNGATAAQDGLLLPASLTMPLGAGIVFPDQDRAGRPKPTCVNAILAIEGLGVTCRFDTFHNRMLVGGHAIQQWAGDLSDNAVHCLRGIIHQTYGFDPGSTDTRDAAVQLCLQHCFDPVVDYLAGLRWDGTERIETWVSHYLGAPDNPLTRQIGRLSLIAAVRRARHPGTKFDQIIVLEGPEGIDKSKAIATLAGPDNFSDQNILAASDKEQQEAVQGVWLYELSEMAGMRRTDAERIKQFASRTEDRARPVYGHFRVDQKRRCLFFGTTNKDTYLQSETGNRRFWPIRTGHIRIGELQQDRDQLWAEAAYCETAGASIELPRRFWEAAKTEQAERLEEDAWQDLIHTFVEKNQGDVSIFEILTSVMHMRLSEIGQTEQTRAARILIRLGLRRYQKRLGERLQWRYRVEKR